MPQENFNFRCFTAPLNNLEHTGHAIWVTQHLPSSQTNNLRYVDIGIKVFDQQTANCDELKDYLILVSFTIWRILIYPFDQSEANNFGVWNRKIVINLSPFGLILNISSIFLILNLLKNNGESWWGDFENGVHRSSVL